MSQLAWHEAIKKTEPLVFRIHTPNGRGSGFLVSQSKTTNIVAVATALHVVNHAYTWNEPIQVQHYLNGKTFFLKPADRAIFINTTQDTAAIIFKLEGVDINEPVPTLIEKGHIVKTGVEVGWLGFPTISSGELCFFSGRISSQIDGETAYLVDGVAINGVSGGPVLWLDYQEEVKYMGIVSAYIPNRSTGDVLPGLAVIQGVFPFHDDVSRIKSVDEAKNKEAEIQAQQTELDTETSKNQS